MENTIIFGDAFASGYHKLIELYNDKETGIADKLKNKYTVSYKIIRIPGGAGPETELGIFLGLSTDYPAKLEYKKGPDGSLKEWVNNTDQTVLIFRKIQTRSSSPGRDLTVAASSSKSGSTSRSRSQSRSTSRSRSASKTEAAKPRSRSKSGARGGRSIKKRKHRKSRR